MLAILLLATSSRDSLSRISRLYQDLLSSFVIQHLGAVQVQSSIIRAILRRRWRPHNITCPASRSPSCDWDRNAIIRTSFLTSSTRGRRSSSCFSRRMTSSDSKDDFAAGAATAAANIAVIGCGWWSQGWHLPVLHNNPKCNLVAIVDSSPHPTSNLNPDLVSLSELAEKYHTQVFASVQELLQNDLGPTLDGVLIATPHATHYLVGKEFLQEIDRREQEHGTSSTGISRPLHIMMEKPMTTDVEDAVNLFRLVHPPEVETDNAESSKSRSRSQFWLNHTANYRTQTGLAREAIVSGRLGKIRHVTASFASPLKWIFNDPGNDGWNKPHGNMVGNGFAWGQSSHLLAFLFHILPNCDPKTVHCRMALSKESGADIAHSATIECLDKTVTVKGKEVTDLLDDNTVLINMSGTALLPGHQYTNPPIAKLLNIDVYGDDGSLHYSGNDLDPTSGHLEYRNAEGIVEILFDRFEFEAYDNENLGPESIQSFVELCCNRTQEGKSPPIAGATALDGLRTVQVIDAMYKSNATKQVVPVVDISST